MEVKTYRAGTMHEALMLVRRELGPDAAVLHTREVRTSRWFGLVPGVRQIEVTASAGVNVPSRLPRPVSPPSPTPADNGISLQSAPEETRAGCQGSFELSPQNRTGLEGGAKAQASTLARSSDEVQGQLSSLQTMVQELCRRSSSAPQHDLPEQLFGLFTDLLDSELSEELARELVEKIRVEVPRAELGEPVLLKARVGRMIESEIECTGPIQVTPGSPRLVALVGPTGVGKTTTIAKLAANYRLKEKRRVGLITVDTYRIAAVEQLRTYADIIDLPMEVVSTPREMREAVRRMHDVDLVLLDTAGRSPKDEVKIQELRAFLTEAGAHEVHLVLSSVAGERALIQTAERFATVGTTTLIFTKLDEATGLGHFLPVIRASRLPVSYLTNGQNVPDDIETADPHRLANMILAVEPSSKH